MKAITVIMAGLINCATMLHAQDAATQSPNDAGLRNLVAQATNPSLLWTNKVSFESIEEQSFVNGSFNVANLHHTAQSDLPSTNYDDQVFVLFLDDVAPVATEGEIRRVVTTESKTSPAHRFSEDEILYWRYGITSTILAAQKEEAGKKKPVQTLFIEPLRAPMSYLTDRSGFREYTLTKSHPKPAWHEWFNPRVIIPKWTEFWMTESDATPVVLVMTTF